MQATLSYSYSGSVIPPCERSTPRSKWFYNGNAAALGRCGTSSHIALTYAITDKLGCEDSMRSKPPPPRSRPHHHIPKKGRDKRKWEKNIELAGGSSSTTIQTHKAESNDERKESSIQPIKTVRFSLQRINGCSAAKEFWTSSS